MQQYFTETAIFFNSLMQQNITFWVERICIMREREKGKKKEKERERDKREQTDIDDSKST